MKNTMKNKNILQALTGILFVAILVVGALSIAPLAHAQDDGGDYSDGGCGCGDTTGFYDTGSGYAPTTDNTGWYDTGSAYTPSASTDNTGWYDVGSGYTPSGYSTSGYSTSGYSTGGGYRYSLPSYSYSTPVYQQPVYQQPVAQAPSNTNVNVNNNTCTGNSCNTNITNPAPVINNVVANYGATNTTQYCASGYYGTYPNCYRNQQPVVYQQAPIAYNTATPYVSLSQVPYTGLDLGFWGTIAYWGAMILFALVVAYLIAIKRVQNSIARYMKNFLFGTTEVHEETVVTAHAEAHAPVAHAAAHVAPAQESSEDVIDSFILSQISRPRHA